MCSFAELPACTSGCSFGIVFGCSFGCSLYNSIIEYLEASV